MLPDIIKKLPEADIPFDGIRGWLSQGEFHQVVFFEIDAVGELPAHSHGAQWGIVVEGKMDLTIGDVTKTFKKGNSYNIPEGVVHSATFKQKTWVIDFFDDRDRYGVK